jgi:hypothetical protein
MSINVTVATAGQNLGTFSFENAAVASQALTDAGGHLAEMAGETVTLTFSQGEATGTSVPSTYGSAEGFVFDVTVKTTTGTGLATLTGVELTQVAQLLSERLGEALSYYPVIVAELAVFDTYEEDEDEDESDDLDELFEDEDPTLPGTPENDPEPVLADGAVKEAVTEAVEILGGITVNELLDSGLDPITYGSIVVELRSAL